MSAVVLLLSSTAAPWLSAELHTAFVCECVPLELFFAFQAVFCAVALAFLAFAALAVRVSVVLISHVSAALAVLVFAAPA